MFKFQIIKNDEVTNQASFPNQEEANAWLEQETANKSFGEPEDYTVEQEDITQAVASKAAKQEAREYLTDTDWMIIREMDSGVPTPTEIKSKRQQSRDILNGAL
jgi:hypothetical protein